MSDLAPIFTGTGVAEVLRCKTVEDLTRENQELKQELGRTRIVVSVVSIGEETKTERTVAGGYLEQIEAVTLEDFPANYANLLGDPFHARNDNDPYYAIKLEKIDEWIGSTRDFDDVVFVVRLHQGDSNVILGVLAEAMILNLQFGFIRSMLVHVDRDKPHTMVELNSTKQCFVLDHLCHKMARFDNHPYWDNAPRCGERPRSTDEEVRRVVATHQFIDNSPENSAEFLVDYLVFHQVDSLVFVDEN